jgi:hypothetical protein
MGLFGDGSAPRTVVKTYGRWSFLGLISPLLAVLYVGKLRSEGRLASEDPAVIHDMAEMARKGYRVVSMETYELPVFGIDYRKVTFERAEDPAS